ncbi:ABC transporter ATP-binding protein [Paenibacillus senegalensis]|uniref:ABC transporter ATP-binding protein n=1 Tax=Paenibacillus senegalensis TaxID=1465766 RepID=UPI000287EE12|nr:ABC transporter ATP-binding protein [Paenibacillus senegalensis]
MQALKQYFQFIRPYKAYILITVLIGIVKFGIPLTLPLIMKYVVDMLLTNPEMPVSDKIARLFGVLGLAGILFVVVRPPIEYFRQYFAQMTTAKIQYDIRHKLYDHIQKLSLRFYQNRKIGEVISRFINDVEQTKNIVEVGLMNIWLDLVTLTIAIGIMFFLDPMLALIAVAVFPLYGLSVKILYKRLKQLTKDRSQALAEVQAYLHERLQGIPVIRSFTLEKYEQGRFASKNGVFLEKSMDLTRWNALTFAVINTLTDIAPLLVIGYGGYQAIQGNLSVGSLVAFFAYLERLYSPLGRIVNSSTVLTQAHASVERVVEFMNESYDIVNRPDARIARTFRGHIEYRNVSFAYNEADPMVLRNIHLTIEPGQTIALVGPSGGGKSSLVSLLPRFYDIRSGQLLIDGIDIRDMTMESLRSQIGMVLQDNILFSGTIRDNILLGRTGADPDEVVQAAKQANAHDFIMDLPNGYDTEIGERGVKLSGGQKQRIAIARVFLKNPRILILDEATSALDLHSEALIQQSLDKLAEDRTTLIVAHRLSTITHADQIVLVKNGQISEKGTHAELMQNNGEYAQLFNIQQLTQEKDSEDNFL